MSYAEFIFSKTQLGEGHGFNPSWLPDFLFDFQKHLVEWSIRLGRAAIFADCGMGKTPMQLVWAENVVRKTNGNVLVLAPLAVSGQTVHEAEKFGIECHRSRDGKPHGKITITNYEQLHRFDPADFVGVVCDESSILKNFKGSLKNEITVFMRKLPYRLLATATPSPNEIAIIDQLTVERDEAKKTGGYTCHVCGALRTEYEIVKKTSDEVTQHTAERCAEIVDDVVQDHRWGSDGSCGVNTAIKSVIKSEFGLSEAGRH